MNDEIIVKVELPSGITATRTGKNLIIKGPKGEVTKKLFDPLVIITADTKEIKISCDSASKRQKRSIKTFAAHAKTMILGVQKPYAYKLKICSGHFPMNVSVSGDKLIVKNFLGEKSPRTMTLKKGATVKVEGEFINVESPDKEIAGQVSSDIELITRKTNRDLRIFQDGIYIIEKAGNSAAGE